MSMNKILNFTSGKLSSDRETLNDTLGKLSPGGESFGGHKFSKLFDFSLVLKKKTGYYILGTHFFEELILNIKE